MLGALEPRNPRDPAGGPVQHRERVGPHRQIAQPGGEPVGGEGEAPAVGRPGRLQVGVRVVGQPHQRVGLEIVHEQVGEAAHHRGERDLPAVGRPARIEDVAQLGQLDLALDAAAGHVVQVEHRPAARDPGEHEPPPVARPASRRLDELQALEMGVHRRAGELPFHLPRMRVGQVQVHREQAAVGEEHHLAAVGAERRGQVVLTHLALDADELGTVPVGQLGLRAQGVVGGMGGRVPAGHQLVGRELQHRPDSRVHAPCPPRGAEQLADPVVAVGAAHIGEQRLAVPVREESRVLELAIGRERVARGVLDRAPHPHRGERRVRPQREVLGHPLDEPERQRRGAGHAASAAGRPR